MLLAKLLLVFIVAALGLCMPVLLPAIQADELYGAIRRGVVGGQFGGVDLLAYLKPDNTRPLHYMNAIAALAGDHLPMLELPYHLSHMGLLGFVVAASGAFHAIRRERNAVCWLIIAILFWSLSLGLDVHLGGRRLGATMWTPYRLLENSIVFELLRWPHRFVLPFVFPFALLIGYGMRFRIESITWNRPARVMLVLTTVLLLFGTSMFPIPMRADLNPPYLAVLPTCRTAPLLICRWGEGG